MIVKSIAVVAWGGDAKARGTLSSGAGRLVVSLIGAGVGEVAVLARFDSISSSGWSALSSLVSLIWVPKSCSSSSSASVS